MKLGILETGAPPAEIVGRYGSYPSMFRRLFGEDAYDYAVFDVAAGELPGGVEACAAYLVTGLCAALAGVIVAGDIKGADANNAGLWMELDVILAVVLGGNSLLGGRFSITASVLGALIIQSINSAILLSGMPVEFNLVIKALLIIMILMIQSPKVKHSLYLLRAGAPRDAAAQTPPGAGSAVRHSSGESRP